MSIDIKEAARRLGKSEKTLRRWVHTGKLPSHTDDTGRLLFAVSDIEAHQAGPSDSQRIEALEHRVTELERQVARLASAPTKTLRPPRIPYQAEAPAPAPGEGLPPGYTPIYDLIKEHGLVRQRNAIMRQMRPYLKTGHWKVAGHEVKNCLDQEGVNVFLRRYVPPGS